MLDQKSILLWVDMLGYKNWLERQDNLKGAADSLKNAISVAFDEADTPQGISAELLSDTILCFCDASEPEKIHALILVYHFLSIRLSNLGLPIRGCITVGELYIDNEPPRILLGNAISDAASLEQSINEFTVVAHPCFVDFVNDLDTPLSCELVSWFSYRVVSTKKGNIEHNVVNWGHPYVAEAILQAYKLLISRLRSGDETVHPELLAFLPKFINSYQMINTTIAVSVEEVSLYGDEWNSNRIRDLWEEAQKHARLIFKGYNN